MGKIPDKLLQPPSETVIELPVDSKLQELPYEKLTWENFEKLCLRLAEQQNEVEECRQYGVRGDNQGGIDIYAKNKLSLKYIVYQCKKEKNYGPAKIRDAIDIFLKGDWVNKTEKFVLCTQESLQKQNREDEVIRQREILSQKNITLKVWDSHGLDRELKKRPQLVYDFFGEPWLTAFCGIHAMAQVQQKTLPKKREYSKPDLYISRRIVSESTEFLFEKGKEIKEILEKEKRIALIGWAGSGKSIELQRLAYELSNKNGLWYPFLINLYSHTDKSIKNYIPEIDDIPKNRIVLLLDGLDEVQNANMNIVGRQIVDFCNEFPNARVIVSCRSNFYTTDIENSELNTLRGFISYSLTELSQSEIDKYIERKIPLKKKSFFKEITDKNLEKLIHTPYYLIKLSEQYQNENRISNSKAELFEEVIKENIKRDAARYFPNDRYYREKEMRESIEKLAFLMEYQGRNYCEWAELQSWFPEKKLEVLKRVGSLLDSKEGDQSTWKFKHNNLQEYLTAKFISTKRFEEIKKIISFPPLFSKIKPTWVNTLSFLISILEENNDIRKKLIFSLIKNEPELVIKFEPDKLNSETRHQIFVKIFNFYKKDKRYINRTRFNVNELANFSLTEKTLEFLIGELHLINPVPSRGNALLLVSHYPVEINFLAKRNIVKELIEKNLFGEDSELKHLAINAYVKIFDLNDGDFASLVSFFIQSTDTWIRYILFYAFHKQGYQDKYIDLIIKEIKTLVLDELIENERLADEYYELNKCITSLQDFEAIDKTLDFIFDNFESINYSIYFGEIITHLLKIVRTLFPENEVLQKKIITGFSNKVRIHDKRSKEFIEFFTETDIIHRAFVDIYQMNSHELDYGVLDQLAQLATEGNICFLAQEFKESRINREVVEDFQYSLKRHDKFLKLFNELVNEKEMVPLPIQRDFEKEEYERNKKIKELLFNKSAFKNAIEQVFIDIGKERLTKNEIREFQRTEYHGKYLPVVYQTIFFFHRSQNINKNEILTYIEKNWDTFSIAEIIRFLKQVNKPDFSEEQINFLKKWCYTKSSVIDFTKALSKPSPDSTSADGLAIQISYLIRKLNFKDYSTDFYLSLLSFQKWDDNEVTIFEFVKCIVPKDKIDKRVIKNLSEGIKYGGVLLDHLKYCVEHNLKQVTPILIPYLINEDHNRYEVLNSYLKLNGGLKELEGLLPEIKDHFRYQLISDLIKNGSGTILKFLTDTFKVEQNEEDKLKLAGYLIQLQNIEGINFYINYIKEKKIVPSDSSPGNPFYSLTKVNLIWKVFHLFEMSIDPSIQQNSFNRLDNIAIESLRGISLFDNNYPKAKRAFKLYEYRFRILKLIKCQKLPEKVLLDLKHYFENFELQYFINKSSNINSEEALQQYNKFGRTYSATETLSNYINTILLQFKKRTHTRL